jgi:hypothetical protein
MQVQVILRKVRETKGAALFQEVEQKDGTFHDVDQTYGKINTMYVRKNTFNGTIPDKITVTIEY